jgi:ribosomal protein S18 acetylase RimI-like enzyme
MVIERDGEPIGRLYRWRVGTALRIIDIALVPECRGRGIGTALIRSLMAEASDGGADVTLYVERFNPAFRLYTRLGFEPVEDGPVYSLLRWQPGNEGQLKTAS